MSQTFSGSASIPLASWDFRARITATNTPSRPGPPFQAIKTWRAGGAGTFSLPGYWSLDGAESLTKSAQRLLLSRQSLAQEFSEADISPHFRANGSTDPDDPAYVSLAKSGFQDWRLEVAGLVSTPLSLSLSELRALPSRTQITRHDCVEGWSCIGKWTGVPLSVVLQRAGLAPDARYIVFYCADRLGEELGEPGKAKYYESIDLHDAFHPQTILAYEMNGAPLRDPLWSTASPSRGTPARLQDGQVRHEDRSCDKFRAYRRRPGRLLGRPWIPMVCRHLIWMLCRAQTGAIEWVRAVPQLDPATSRCWSNASE